MSVHIVNTVSWVIYVIINVYDYSTTTELAQQDAI